MQQHLQVSRCNTRSCRSIRISVVSNLPLQCSVSCGLGIQRRELLCLQLTATGHQVMLEREQCSGLPSPPLVRTCRMMACPSKSTQTSFIPSCCETTLLFLCSRWAFWNVAFWDTDSWPWLILNLMQLYFMDTLTMWTCLNKWSVSEDLTNRLSLKKKN